MKTPTDHPRHTSPPDPASSVDDTRDALGRGNRLSEGVETVMGRILSLLQGMAAQLERLEKARLQKESYTVAEAAERLGKSSWTVRQWCNRGQVPGAYKVGRGRGGEGEWRIPHEALIRLENFGPNEPSLN
jgi:excisionase family DNA binding protein